MRKIWLFFSQAVTVLLAAYFVVATLKPEWLGRAPRLGSTSGVVGTVPVLEAPAANSAAAPAGSYRAAAQKASAAVVSIATAKAAPKNERTQDFLSKIITAH